MTVQIRHFNTAYNGGVNLGDWIDDAIIREVNFEETVGDEKFLQSGNLELVTTEELSGVISIPTYWVWFAVYIDSILYNVYYGGYGTTHPEFVEYDEKTGFYKYNLQPIQGLVYAAAKENYINESSGWGSGIDSSCYAQFESITAKDGSGGSATVDDAYAFLVAGLLDALSGIAYDGFEFDTISHDIMPAENNGAVFLVRGLGLESATDLAENYFENYGFTYHDLFRLVALGTNSFIRVVPEIDGGFLKISLSFVTKSSQSSYSAISGETWTERKVIPGKFKVDGVVLSGTNFTYGNGDITGNDVIEADLPVSDIDVAEEDYITTLYMFTATYNEVTGYAQDENYFIADNLDDYYDDLVEQLDGYEGKLLLKYNDGTDKLLKVLDQLNFNSTVYIQLSRISFTSLSGICSIEGVVI